MSCRTPAWPGQVAIIGAGTMGAGIAFVFARSAIPCTVADRTQERARDARTAVVASAHAYEATGLLDGGDADRIERALASAASIDAAVQGADFVIEAVFEDLETKQQAYRRIERSVADDAVIASNTSAIPIRDLAETLTHPHRFLGTHWFNPAQWIPGVEVIPTDRTDSAVVTKIVDLHRTLGKTPVVVCDSAGFVANRLQFALFKEAAELVGEGGVTAAQVDEVVRNSFGFRLPFFGPFAIADMAGLDVYAGAFEPLRKRFGERLAAPASVREAVSDGRLGVKSGRGYLEWPAQRTQSEIAERDRLYAGLRSLLDEVAPADGAAE